ncbi:MAG: hypothetical protein JSR76_06600 [Verrucomicrobia bacterium]|nr:hypothetical protein [Verrucomicrobiota bacterium]
MDVGQVSSVPRSRTAASLPQDVEEGQNAPVQLAQGLISRGRGNTTARGEPRPLDRIRVTKVKGCDPRGTGLTLLVICFLTACMGVQMIREQALLKL